MLELASSLVKIKILLGFSQITAEYSACIQFYFEV